MPRKSFDSQGRLLWVGADEFTRTASTILSQVGDAERRRFALVADAINLGQVARASERPEATPVQDECDGMIAPRPASHGPALDFDSLARLLPTVLVGEVVATDDGLYAGKPYTLLLVSVDRWLKRNDNLPETTEVFVSYASPEVRIADMKFCRSSAALPSPPSVGTPVLLTINTAVGGLAPNFIGNTPLLPASDHLVYDGLVDGIKTLMASESLLSASPDWLINASVASLEARVLRGLQQEQEDAR